MKLYKSKAKVEGYTKIVDASYSDLKHIEMGQLYFEKTGSSYTGSTGNREFGINILSGIIKLTVSVEKTGMFTYEMIGKRMDPFSGSPAMIYLPINSNFTIEVIKSPFHAAVYSAISSTECKPEVINPEDVVTTRTGQSNWTRFVRKGIGDNSNASRLIIGETLTPSGNWTSYPSHKHDECKPPCEKPLEEVYSFYFDNPSGFALIRLYTPKGAESPFDEAYVMNEGDTITINRGYHPIAVAPGYKCCYLFCLAGEERKYGAWSDDPNHSWIRGCETVLQGNKLE